MNNYAEQKKTEISKIEDIIKQYCPKEEGLQKIIFEAPSSNAYFRIMQTIWWK